MGHLLKANEGVRALAATLPAAQRAMAGTLALRECPEAIVEAHGRFAAAGADVLTAFAFSCTPRSLRPLGREAEAAELAGRAVELAVRAVGINEGTIERGEGVGASSIGPRPQAPRPAREAPRRGEGTEEGTPRWGLTTASGSPGGTERRNTEEMGPPGEDKGLRPRRRVAGSLPPLIESYSSEGASEAALPSAELEATYFQLARAQLARGASILLVETMATTREAVAAASAATKAVGLSGIAARATSPSTPQDPLLWVSFSVHDDGSGRLRGEGAVTASKAAEALLRAAPSVDCVLINCTSPRGTEGALRGLVEWRARDPAGRRVRIGAYPNAFVTSTDDWLAAGGFRCPGGEPAAGIVEGDSTPGVEDRTQRPGEGGAGRAPGGTGEGEDAPRSPSPRLEPDLQPATLDPEEFAEAAVGLWRLGADVLGGCCGAGPEHIRALRRRLEAEGAEAEGAEAEGVGVGGQR